MPPRIVPLTLDEMSEAQKELILPYAQGGHIENVFSTMAHHPDLLKRWGPLIRHVLFKSTLEFRDREILILRIGYQCRAEYEWAQHVKIGRSAGLSDEDVALIMLGRGMSRREDALLNAADELWDRARISDKTWSVLSEYYRPEQLMDVVFTVAQYTMVSMALNSFGVELDEGLEGFPPLPPSHDP